jgi:eukaryotic-like serine/threonine-protein kinase
MSLPASTRFGPYEITAPIGAGGMGEVYRAVDSRLGREVALKVLPEAFASDPERLARFEREAKLLASLNHPNIAHIYGFESATQPDGSQAHFLAMELVDGQDLAERLSRGPLDLDDALDVARQLAEALEEAHERGIVHRDLKPANIRIRPDGKVKVLDFGLAKAFTGEASTASAPDLTQSPTLAPNVTRAGVILGTPAYMSPEQARGKPVDRRADVWAFGVVLYEMLTGSRLFAAGTWSDTLAAVLTAAPDWSLLPAGTPPSVRRLLRRCLERDTRRRLGWMGGARLELDDSTDGDEPGARAATEAPAPRRAMPVIGAVFGGVLMGLLAGFLGWGPARRRAAPVIRLSMETSTAADEVAISPDGSSVLLRRGGTLAIRRMTDPEAVPIKGVAFPALTDPMFSPDGQSIAFAAGRTLKRVPAAGGEVVDIAVLPGDETQGCSWSKDDIYCGLGALGIVKVPAGGGPVEKVVTLAAGAHAATPQLLEGGDVLIFAEAPGSLRPDWSQSRIVAQSRSSGRRSVIAESGSDPHYLATGHIAYAVEGVLYAVGFDAKSGRVLGSPLPMVRGVGRQSRGGLLGPRANVAFSSTGTLVYLAGSASRTAPKQVVFADRAGREHTLALAPREYESPRVSPDGRRIALSTNGSEEAAVWVYDLSEEHAARRLTFAGRSRLPVWSPDGKRLAFQSDRSGDTAIFVQNADGSGEAERLTTAEAGTAHVPESWTRDGRRLSFSVVKASGAELWIRSMTDARSSPFGDVRSSAPVNSALSPDGKWIAYTLRGRTGAASSAVFLQPVPATGAVYQITEDNDSSHHPFWSPDGKELFHFAQGGGTLVSTTVALTGSVTSGRPGKVAGAHPSNTTIMGPLNYDITPDGRELVFTRGATLSATDVDARGSVKVVLNWFQELDARAPRR